MLDVPPLRIRTRLRPINLIAPHSRRALQPTEPLAAPAPYVALERPLADADEPAQVTLNSAGHSFTAHLADGRVWLSHDTQGQSRVRSHVHRSRRHGATSSPPTALALTLTGVHVSVLTCEAGEWIVRARLGIREYVDPHDPAWLATLSVGGDREVVAGEFGQLGLRDVRLATWADGAPYAPDGELWFTATHAGPGFFDTAHSGLWRLVPGSWQLTHEATHFFARPGGPSRRHGVYGDHASHLVRDGEQWVLATSTWGDFDREAPSVEITVSTSSADLTQGTHVVASSTVSVAGLDSPGVWDPHLVRTGDGWLMGLVCAKKFFDFAPAIAQGSTLDSLTLRARDPRRRATEGTTVLPADGTAGRDWVVIASDGRDGRRGQRAQFPVFDLDLRELGTLTAPYPSNIGWPTLVHTARLQGRTMGEGTDSTPNPAWTMLTFNGVRRAGRLAGYGTHGDLVIMTDEAR